MNENSIFNGMFGNIAPGMCRFSMNGDIAIKTSFGYRVFDGKRNHLVNCQNFALDIGQNFFMVMPTTKVKPGDIILARSGEIRDGVEIRTPRYVLEADTDQIRTVNYETSVVETLLPERFIFMGNTYFYGKIVSPFGGRLFSGKKGGGRLMKMFMISSFLKGNAEEGSGGLMNMLPLMMMGKEFGSMFDGLTDDEDDEEEEGYEDE